MNARITAWIVFLSNFCISGFYCALFEKKLLWRKFFWRSKHAYRKKLRDDDDDDDDHNDADCGCGDCEVHNAKKIDDIVEEMM